MSRRGDAQRRVRPVRVRLAAAGAALAVVVAGLGIALGGSAAAADPQTAATAVGFVRAPSGTATTEVDSGDSTLKLSATPSQGLPATGAQITVRGSGFNTDNDLWVAICLDNGVAPAAFIYCIGGSIPDGNASSAWATVTSDGNPSYPGPVGAKWKSGGSFALTLQIPSAFEANCIPGPCSVYTRSADNDDRSQDAHVSIQFVEPGHETAPPPPPTPPTTTAPPTTEVIGGVPTTVSPEVVQSSSIPVGGSQTVLFAGFTPGEDVAVTLFSDPITLPNAKADGSGNVRITFDIPDDLPPGAHLIQAVGLQSNRVGIAQFTVTPTDASNSESASGATDSAGSTSVTESPGVSNSSAADVSESGVVLPPLESTELSGLSSSAVSSEPSESAQSTLSSASGAGAGAATDDGGSGTRLLWLWIVLVLLVLAAGAAGVIVMVRSRRDRDHHLPTAAATMFDPAHGGEGDGGSLSPGWSDETHTAPAGYAGGYGTGYAPGVDPHSTAAPEGGFGLLTGRDEHPDNLGLYANSGWADAPTGLIGSGVDPGMTEPGGDAGPATEAWSGPTTEAWSGPPTEAWSGPSGADVEAWSGPSTEAWPGPVEPVDEPGPDLDESGPSSDGPGPDEADPDVPRRGRHHHSD